MPKATTSASKYRNIVEVRVRQARLERQPRVTQEDLSALLEAYGVKLNQTAISKIESGDRVVLDYELKAMGESLYVPVSWLLNEE